MLRLILRIVVAIACGLVGLLLMVAAGGWWLLLSIVDLQHDLYPALRGILFILTLGAVWLPDPDSAASGSSLGPWLLGGLGALLVFLSAGLFWRRERRDDDSSHA